MYFAHTGHDHAINPLLITIAVVAVAAVLATVVAFGLLKRRRANPISVEDTESK